MYHVSKKSPKALKEVEVDIDFFDLFHPTGSFTRTDKKYHDTAAEQGFLECWVGS